MIANNCYDELLSSVANDDSRMTRATANSTTSSSSALCEALFSAAPNDSNDDSVEDQNMRCAPNVNALSSAVDAPHNQKRRATLAANTSEVNSKRHMTNGANGKKTKGRVKIKMEFIDNKLRRYTTFSKRKTGIMKKAYELSTLTGTQVMLLVASETGHVYTFATRKLQPMITSDAGKALIQTCLNSPDSGHPTPSADRMSVNGYEEVDLTYAVVDAASAAAQTQCHFNSQSAAAVTLNPHHNPLQHHHVTQQALDDLFDSPDDQTFDDMNDALDVALGRRLDRLPPFCTL